MKIFITGIAGFLGANLADHFLKLGHEVHGCDNLIGGDLKNLKNLNVIFSKGDCSDIEFMKSVIVENTDCVIHAAAYAHEGLSVFAPYLIASNIFSASVSVFSASIIKKVKRVVFCSSMARYGDLQKEFEETDVPKPEDPYGIAKLAAEDVLKCLSETHGIEYNIAIPHNIIGRKQKYHDPYRNVAAIMINRILQNKQPVIYGDGEQKRSFSDVRDCIFCLDKMVTDKKINKETFNIGPGKENYITINKLSELISNKLQFNMPPIYVKERPREVKFPVCSPKKAEKILGYKTNYSVEDTLSDMIEDIKQRGPLEFDYNYEVEIINSQTPKTWKNKLI